MATINWNLGGGFTNFEVIGRAVNIMKFYKPKEHNVSVFDAPFGCIWEGGRSFVNGFSVDEELSQLIEFYNQNG